MATISRLAENLTTYAESVTHDYIGNISTSTFCRESLTVIIFEDAYDNKRVYTARVIAKVGNDSHVLYDSADSYYYSYQKLLKMVFKSAVDKYAAEDFFDDWYCSQQLMKWLGGML